LLLTSFVWPFDLHPHDRLRSAFAVAAMHPVYIDKATASSWLPNVLGPDPDDGLPIVWYSITQMYWPTEEITAVKNILTNHGAQQRLGKRAWNTTFMINGLSNLSCLPGYGIRIPAVRFGSA
jgi:hypothetical protein